MPPQADLFSKEQYIVSFRRQDFPSSPLPNSTLVTSSESLAPPLFASSWAYNTLTTAPPPANAFQVSAVFFSPLAAVAATASPSPTLSKRLTAGLRTLFRNVWARLLLYGSLPASIARSSTWKDTGLRSTLYLTALSGVSSSPRL